MNSQLNEATVFSLSDPFQIKPTYSLSGIQDPKTHLLFLNAIQNIVDEIIPSAFKAEIDSINETGDASSLFFHLKRMLPLFKHSKIDDSTDAFSFTYFCSAEYTHGVGRYVKDTLIRWLIPGKQIEISGGICLNFQFVQQPALQFFLDQSIITIRNKEERQAMIRNLPALIDEMKINILSVYHARYIASLRDMTGEQKHLLIQKKLSTLLNRPIGEENCSLYDQMQQFIVKLSSEEKIDQVKKNIAQLAQSRPKIFDRDVFYEMTHLTHQFNQQFSLKRDPRHISRVIAYLYLFKKSLEENLEKVPFRRHLSLKIFPSHLASDEPLLAILIGINFLKENERFEIRHLLESIRTCFPEAVYVERSLVVDRRHDKIRFFYLEIKKNGGEKISLQEMKTLKSKLPGELLRQIETVVHPLFMPRNEEEIIRTLIVLSKQIKYVRDLPQATIHYDQQTDADLTFTIVLVRLLKDRPLAEILSKNKGPIRIDIDDIRILGQLRQKYPKEAAILRVTLDKAPFFRPDYSVDLLRARQKIGLELTRLLGEFRDFNGGIILKQEEALKQLRKEMGFLSKTRECLLENYFYSLRPGIMQTIHETHLLKSHFLLLLRILETNSREPYLLVTEPIEKFFLGFIISSVPTFKEEIANAVGKLKLASYELTTSFLQIEEMFAYGFILKAEAAETAKQFETALVSALKEWEIVSKLSY